MVVYINLTDTEGSLAKTWFYAANGIQNQALDVAIAAINGYKRVEVAATAPVSGNQPFTDISRLYLLATSSLNLTRRLITVGFLQEV